MPIMMTGRRPIRSASIPQGHISNRLTISVIPVSLPDTMPATLWSVIPRCSARMYGWEKFMLVSIPMQIRDAYM